jgi:uncharacterized membrane protein
MEASLEERLRLIEARLAALEFVLSNAPAPAPPAPVPALAPAPKDRGGSETPWPPVVPQPAPAVKERRPGPDLEEVLGGRVLAWVGGAAVVLGVVFFLVMAVSRGWIDKPTRVVLAFIGSAALLGGALWLYERKGQTQAALAAAAAALASLYASLIVGTAVYGLIPDAAGFAVAGLVGAVGAAIAVRGSSQVVGVIGILGALLAPVLVDAGASTASLAFMAIALTAAVGVLVWQRWPWLAFASFVVSMPQLVNWMNDEYGGRSLHRHVVLILAVLVLYWALYLVGALAYEVRVRAEKLSAASALLLFADVLLVSGAGWIVLHDAGRKAEATAWVLALAAGHVAVGAVTLRGRMSRQTGELLIALGTALSAVGFALALHGPALVTGWALQAALLVWLGSRTQDDRATAGGAAFLVLAIGHVLLKEAPPRALVSGLDHTARGLVALAVVVATAAFAARVAQGRVLSLREPFAIVAAATAVYLVSVGIVDAAGATRATGATQTSQLSLSAFWSATGLAAIVAGLLRDQRQVRLGGLALLGIAVVKVFLFDLRTLGSIYRVGSFIALGLLLIAGAFAYQRVQREVHE